MGKPGARGNRGRREPAQKPGSLAKFTNIFQKQVTPKDTWQRRTVGRNEQARKGATCSGWGECLAEEVAGRVGLGRVEREVAFQAEGSGDVCVWLPSLSWLHVFPPLDSPLGIPTLGSCG